VRIYRTIAKTVTFLQIPFLQSQKTVISFPASRDDPSILFWLWALNPLHYWKSRLAVKEFARSMDELNIAPGNLPVNHFKPRISGSYSGCQNKRCAIWTVFSTTIYTNLENFEKRYNLAKRSLPW